MALTCICGYGEYTETTSGGAVCGGSATITFNREYPSGGAICAGSATITTNILWDGYASVYHLIEEGDGTTDEYHESANGLDATGNNGTTAGTPTRGRGIFDYAQVCNGAQYITCPQDSLSNQTDLTVSLWAKVTGNYLDRCFYSRGYTNVNEGEGCSVTIGHRLTNATEATIRVQATADWTTYTLTGEALTLGCWYHFAVVFASGSSAKFYINGELQDTETVAETSLVPSTRGSFIGRRDNRNYTEGYIQEVRTAAIARDAEWLETEYMNLCDSDFITVGEVETYGA